MVDGVVPLLLARDEAEQAAVEPGRISALLLRHGAAEVRWYAPREVDRQVPHDRDELYVVVAGRGWFAREEERVAFRPGDALYVPAGVEHRFESFTPDLAVWVVFFGVAG